MIKLLKKSHIKFFILITTMLTVIATYLTINEMKMQRISNSKPMLKIIKKDSYLSNINFYIKEKEGLKEVNNLTQKDMIILWSIQKNFYFPIKLINIGNGPAINIKSKFKFNSTKYFGYFNHTTYSQDFKVKLINSQLYIENKKFNSEKILGEKFDLLLNGSRMNELSLNLPVTYIHGYKSYIENHYISKIKPLNREMTYAYNFNYDDSQENYLLLSLILEYNDINHESYGQEFNINIKPAYIMTNHKNSKFELSNLLYVEEVIK